MLIVVLRALLLVLKNHYRLDSPQNVGIIVSPLLPIALPICIITDAFSKRGFASAFRSAYGRLTSMRPHRKPQETGKPTLKLILF